MYKVNGNGTVIFSQRDDTHRYNSVIGPLERTSTTKGTVFKSSVMRLALESTTTADHPVFVVTAQNFADKKEVSVAEITDRLIASRLLSYLQKHYGTNKTNCSTLARFLHNGRFEECDPKKRGMMFDEWLTPYAGEEIAVGDVVCLLHYRPSSNRLPIKGMETVRDWMTEDVRSRLGNVAISPVLLREVLRLGLHRDYHFLTCVAKKRGLPVFIEQYGRHTPGEKELRRVPIVSALGLKRPKSEGNDLSLFWCKKGR